MLQQTMDDMLPAMKLLRFAGVAGFIHHLVLLLLLLLLPSIKELAQPRRLFPSLQVGRL
jgi:hypothetical protein